jgi:hypothetical protein
MRRKIAEAGARPSLRLSARRLAALARPGGCPRCQWLEMRMGYTLPFARFSGIFGELDRYTKAVVREYFAAHGRPPDWLAALEGVVGYCDPPHFSRFKVLIEEHDLLVTGAPDAIFRRADDSYLIADYKTAKWTEAQDGLRPMYEAQLNIYAMIAADQGFSPVSGLALVYMEPRAGDPDDVDAVCTPAGFHLGFDARIVPVALNVLALNPLMARARGLWDQPDPPGAAPGCRDCDLLERLIALTN